MKTFLVVLDSYFLSPDLGVTSGSQILLLTRSLDS